VNEAVGPLEGLVVVDLSTTLASAYTTLVFADFGAEVVTVEPPGGSDLRSQAGWPFWLRGKKSVVLDFRDAADLAVAHELAVDADVVVDAFRPEVTERLGLGDADLRASNPRIVTTSITGFGRHGPFAHLKAPEAVVMAKTGSMYGPTPSGRNGPVMLNTYGATFAASLLAIQGTLLALHERAVSGYGQHVDATMVQGMLAQDPWSYFLRMLAKRFSGAYTEIGPTDPARAVPNSWLGFGLLTGLSADYRWMQFAHATPKQFDAFVRALGLTETLASPEFKGALDSEDITLRERWWDLMLEGVGSRTVAEWQAVFDADEDTFAEVYLGGTELFDHPQMVHDHQVVELEHQNLGRVRELDVLVKMSATPGSGMRTAPGVDEHAGEVRLRSRRPVIAAPEDPAPVGLPPLAGVTVIDLGTFYAGPFASAMLADQGARVIKVEPLAGDPIRFMMPIPESAGVRVTQGKESIAVDVFTDEGHAIVVELVRRADMILHSYRGGVAERMGLDAAAVHEINPDVVYHHGVGYGIDGPYARRSAYAPTIAAVSGFARHSGGGGTEGTPMTLAEIKHATRGLAGAQSGHPDGFAALGVAAGMALGLVARDRGAGGQETMTTMVSTMAHVQSDIMIEYAGMPAARTLDDERYGYHALYRVYETAADWVVLCVTREEDWRALADSLPTTLRLATDPRFASATARAEHDDELIEVLSTAFRARTAGEWEKVLSSVDVACVEVAPNTGGLCMGLFDDAGVAEQLGMTTTVDHPLFDEHVRSRELVTLSRSGASVGRGCLIGEHTDSILRELGYTDNRIVELRAAGVVGGG
jgi:crotonobetainyl-CoA:carnitine CoA-transferase CaiB-like acyl-CoA transferase